MNAIPFLPRLIACLLTALLCLPTATAQQAQELRRSKTIFLFPEFRDAKIRQSFGRVAKAKANIYLKDGSLFFIKDGKKLKAYTDGIFGVTFGDSIEFMKVDSVMARVVARKGYNALLRLTCVDMKRYIDETYGGAHLDYIDIPELNYFVEMGAEDRDEDMGLPLQNKYFFSVEGLIVPATQTDFKKILLPAQRDAFKKLMQDKFWSWADEKSLIQLLDYLPQ